MTKEGVGQVYCLCDKPLEPPLCPAHNDKDEFDCLVRKAGAEVYPSIGRRI